MHQLLLRQCLESEIDREAPMAIVSARLSGVGWHDHLAGVRTASFRGRKLDDTGGARLN
jgi:hypothetical protein